MHNTANLSNTFHLYSQCLNKTPTCSGSHFLYPFFFCDNLVMRILEVLTRS